MHPSIQNNLINETCVHLFSILLISMSILIRFLIFYLLNYVNKILFNVINLMCVTT